MRIVCFTNEADSKELLQENNDLKFDFIKSFNDSQLYPHV